MEALWALRLSSWKMKLVTQIQIQTEIVKVSSHADGFGKKKKWIHLFPTLTMGK